MTPAQHQHFITCLNNGCSPKLAEMLAEGTPPGANTDREFLQGHCSGSQFEKNPEMGDAYKRIAESHGQDVTGKVYLSGLAAFPGDPRAWVSGRGDAQKVCEERGWACSGSVNVKMGEVVQPEEKYQVDPSLIQEHVADILESNPTLNHEAITEAVTEKLSPNWK